MGIIDPILYVKPQGSMVVDPDGPPAVASSCEEFYKFEFLRPTKEKLVKLIVFRTYVAATLEEEWADDLVFKYMDMIKHVSP